MANYRECVLTNQGLDFARKADNGLIQFSFTKGVLSAEEHNTDSSQTLQNITSLNAFVTSDPVSYKQVVDVSNVIVPLRFTNANQTDNNYVNTVGIYASDGTNEVLYSIIINDDPDLFPAYNGKTPQYIKINAKNEVGRASQVTTTVSPFGMVTEEELSAATKNWVLSASYSSDVSSLSSEIGSVSSAVANNSGIASEFSSVSSGVANNSSAITLLQSSVSTNSSTIGSLQTSVNSNSSNISTLQSSVVSNSNNIGTLQNSVSNNASLITNLSNNKVQDNHDGTVTVNGNVYAITKTLTSAVDFNTLTVPGTYLCPLGIGSYSNSPLAGTGTNASVILQVTNDNAGDIFQVAFAPTIYTPITRQYSFASWSNWLKIANNTDVVNLQNQVNGVLARQSNIIQQFLNYSIDPGGYYNMSTNVYTFNSYNMYGNTISIGGLYTYAKLLGYSNVNVVPINGNQYGVSSYYMSPNTTYFIIQLPSNTNIGGLQVQITYS